jgi:putative tricarboxylic transport membrane protein
MEHLITALAGSTTPDALGAMLLGSLVGIVFGAIPGLTYTMALALVMPFTFGMAQIPAIGLLLATYIGGMTGGCISAILIGIPGTPSTAATVIDGHPMAKNGQASLACGTSIIASAFGGLFSLAVMIVSVEAIARVAIAFGPAEIFALVVFGLSTICGLSEKSLVRGLIAGVIGLMAMTVGQDSIDGVPRLTFGSTTMLQGIDIVVAMVGLFAIPQVINTLRAYYFGGAAAVDPQSVKVELPSWRLLRQNFSLMVRTSSLGTIVGLVPGAHGPVAAFLAYDHAKRFAKDPERFGKGDIRGVIAPECANHSVTGGAMIPMLSLGFPGDPATAIILGGLMIHGLQPGPLLFSEHPAIVYTIYVEIIIGYLMVCLIQLYGVRLFVRTLMVPPHLLAVGILVMCVVGSYAIRNSFLDLYMMLGIGLLGYVLQRVHIPVTPIILGLVLGGTMEREFRTALLMSEGDPSVFYTSPTAMVFFALTILIFAVHIIGQRRARVRNLRRQEA